TWLRGTTTRQTALMLEFGVPQAPLGRGVTRGIRHGRRTRVLSGRVPLRALVKGEATPRAP
ncbi:MAG: hypothetical protein HC933_12570, partial [Pleurocapsa sp. SU_196_0]|nr:hypothetical protein [Pleurocapsa sp. SU_196_0]